MLTAKEKKLLDALEPLAEQNGIEIVTVEIVGAKKSPVIRIYIDTEDGVSFQELTSAQEWIGDTMDRIDPFPGAYTLEVSSPGIDRPLRTIDHFKRFVGEDAKIRASEPIDGQSNFKGEIISAGDDSVVLKCNGDEVEIPFENIRRANIVGKIEF